MVGEIRRLRDEFIDMQIRNENRASGYWGSDADHPEHHRDDPE